jgi:hypothetical protein
MLPDKAGAVQTSEGHRCAEKKLTTSPHMVLDVSTSRAEREKIAKQAVVSVAVHHILAASVVLTLRRFPGRGPSSSIVACTSPTSTSSHRTGQCPPFPPMAVTIVGAYFPDFTSLYYKRIPVTNADLDLLGGSSPRPSLTSCCTYEVRALLRWRGKL